MSKASGAVTPATGRSAPAADFTPVLLPSSVNVAALEQSLARCLHLDRVQLDLRKAKWIEVTALSFLIAILATRRTAGHETQIRLPESKQVRDFLRAWNFQAGVSDAAKMPLFSLVHPDDQRYFGEKQEHYLPSQVASPDTSLMQQLLALRFFGFTTYKLGPSTDQNLEVVEAEGNRWKTNAVERALGLRLKGEAGDLARVIMFELMANVVQHPGANVTSVVSYANPVMTVGATKRTPFPSKHDNFLTICIWDNGTPIATTLSEALAASPTGIRVAETDVTDQFLVKARGWESATTQYPVAWTPQDGAHEAELLMASLFPGISRKASVMVDEVPRRDPVPWFAERGMGLFALYKCVIDQFGGSLSIRTGEMFLNIKSGRSSGMYGIKVESLEPQRRIAGNMFTVRLPLAAPGDGV